MVVVDGGSLIVMGVICSVVVCEMVVVYLMYSVVKVCGNNCMVC